VAYQGPRDRLIPVTVLFVDISDSTTLYAQRGDAIAFGLAKACLDLAAAQVEAAGGRVLRHVGDGILAAFATPGQSLRAAIQIKQAMEDPTCSLESEGVRVHSAMSSGPAVLLADDVYGDVANVAARLVGRAGAGEILLSGKVYEGLPADLRARVQLIDEMLLRNRPTPVLVYKYVADSQLATIRAGATRRASTAVMEVIHDDLLFVVGPERPRVTMGRDPENDVRIEDDVVSHQHAEITIVGDRFILVDRSTNGTYVYPDNGPMLRVLREELVLTGAGRIGLGIEETSRPILYRIAAP
jgi:adenylate cyclase